MDTSFSYCCDFHSYSYSFFFLMSCFIYLNLVWVFGSFSSRGASLTELGRGLGNAEPDRALRLGQKCHFFPHPLQNLSNTKSIHATGF